MKMAAHPVMEEIPVTAAHRMEIMVLLVEEAVHLAVEAAVVIVLVTVPVLDPLLQEPHNSKSRKKLIWQKMYLQWIIQTR